MFDLTVTHKRIREDSPEPLREDGLVSKAREVFLPQNDGKKVEIKLLDGGTITTALISYDVLKALRQAATAVKGQAGLHLNIDETKGDVHVEYTVHSHGDTGVAWTRMQETLRVSGYEAVNENSGNACPGPRNAVFKIEKPPARVPAVA